MKALSYFKIFSFLEGFTDFFMSVVVVLWSVRDGREFSGAWISFGFDGVWFGWRPRAVACRWVAGVWRSESGGRRVGWVNHVTLAFEFFPDGFWHAMLELCFCHQPTNRPTDGPTSAYRMIFQGRESTSEPIRKDGLYHYAWRGNALLNLTSVALIWCLLEWIWCRS